MRGQEFGNYVVREKIGEGGMGEVFLAEHRHMGRKAAIKVLRAHGCANAYDVQRFFNEARAASIIDHPGVVQIFDCDFHENAAFLIMEYLEGESLAALLRRRGGLAADPKAIRAIGTQIANVLGAAHGKGIVHRDLKPDNVFLENKPASLGSFVVRILDFGIAKLAIADAPGLTKSGTVLGTPTYMAPEQCAGDRDVDTRADVYSLGCILYEMALGSPPFVRTGAGSLIVAHMSEGAPAVDVAWPTAPPAFVSLVAQMLAKDPNQRPQTMGEVEVLLHQALTFAVPASTLSWSPSDAPPLAATVSLATQRQSAETQIDPQAMTAIAPSESSGKEDSIPGPTESLPTGKKWTPVERPRAAFDDKAQGYRSKVSPLARKKLSLAVAIGMVLGFSATRRKSSPVVSRRSIALPAAAVDPFPTVGAQPAVAPDESVVAAPPPVAKPELAPQPMADPPAALSKNKSFRLADPAAEMREQGRSPGGRNRARSRHPIDRRSQSTPSMKEIRGFTDF